MPGDVAFDTPIKPNTEATITFTMPLHGIRHAAILRYQLADRPDTYMEVHTLISLDVDRKDGDRTQETSIRYTGISTTSDHPLLRSVYKMNNDSEFEVDVGELPAELSGVVGLPEHNVRIQHALLDEIGYTLGSTVTLSPASKV